MRISDVMSSLVSTYNDWDHLLVNPNMARLDNVIAWPNSAPRRFDLPVLLSDIEDAVSKRQFTFQLIPDGAILQLRYQFAHRTDELVSAQLAYYGTQLQSKPLSMQAEEELEGPQPPSGLYMSMPSLAETRYPYGVQDGPVGWFRVDYAPASTRPIIHHACHMHFSLLPSARLPVTQVPSPRQFVELAIAICYPKEYESHRLDENAQPIDMNRIIEFNRECFSRIDATTYDVITHLSVPPIIR